jgi:tetratricopeptide (TPR) repeat protein
LADIYEREKKYQNAEYIYRDLLDEYTEDEYILQRLGNIYALRGKNNRAIECYESALKSDRANTEILDILAHLALEIKSYKKALKYSNQYLKEKPRHAEKLSIK